MISAVDVERFPGDGTCSVMVILSSTSMWRGLLVAWASETVMTPVYRPQDNPATFTLSVTSSTSPVESPPNGATVSQSDASDTCQFNVPPPQFRSEMLRIVGSGAPSGMKNATCSLSSAIDGAAALNS